MNVTDLHNVHFQRPARLYVPLQVDVQEFKDEVQFLVGMYYIKESGMQISFKISR